MTLSTVDILNDLDSGWKFVFEKVCDLILSFDLSGSEEKRLHGVVALGLLYPRSREKNCKPTTQKPVFSQGQIAPNSHSVTRNEDLTSSSSKSSGTRNPFSS